MRGRRSLGVVGGMLPLGLSACRSILIVGLTCLMLTSCGDDRFPDYRYKITVYAQGKAFSSVRQVRQQEVYSSQDSSGRKLEKSLSGQAVIMDLSDGRRVYAMLSGPNASRQAYGVADVALLPSGYQRPRLGNTLAEMAAEQQVIASTIGPRDLPPTIYHNPSHRTDYTPDVTWPYFAMFDVPGDWKTLHAVSPESVGVKKITVETTDEPVTKGIEELIGKPGSGAEFSQWLQQLPAGDERPMLFGAFFQRDTK